MSIRKIVEVDECPIDALGDKWPSTIVARCKAAEFTGGLVSPGTLANEDSRGTGPVGRFQVGRKTAYPVDSLIAWLKEKATKTRKPANPSRSKIKARKGPHHGVL